MVFPLNVLPTRFTIETVLAAYGYGLVSSRRRRVALTAGICGAALGAAHLRGRADGLRQDSRL